MEQYGVFHYSRKVRKAYRSRLHNNYCNYSFINMDSRWHGKRLGDCLQHYKQFQS